MSSNEVEAILGPPLISWTVSKKEVEAWYGNKPERRMSSYESPWGLGDIQITFQNGLLAQKRYNYQHVSEEARNVLGLN